MHRHSRTIIYLNDMIRWWSIYELIRIALNLFLNSKGVLERRVSNGIVFQMVGPEDLILNSRMLVRALAERYAVEFLVLCVCVFVSPR